MIVRPIVILGAPRSGTTILQRCLALHPDVWHLPSESHAILEGPFHPARKGYESNRVAGDEVDDAQVRDLRNRFYRRAINLNQVLHDPSPLLGADGLFRRAIDSVVVSTVGLVSRSRKPPTIRFVEKTPKNTLRIPLLERLFPDALYVWITRNAVDNIDSLIAGWHAIDRVGPVIRQRYAQAGYPIADQLGLLDYQGKWWKFALVPGWRELKGKTVADVAAWQYYQCNQHVLVDLARIEAGRVFSVKYEDFISSPSEIVSRILAWAGLPPSPVVETFATILPRVNDAGSGARRSRRGLRYSDGVRAAIECLPQLNALQRRMGYES